MYKNMEVNLKDIKILAIETSCDETSSAVVVNGRHVLSNVISSQIELHKKYGGVVPEIASRKHVELIIDVIDRAMKEAQTEFIGIDAIAVTYGPGLVGALLVGVSAAKAIALAHNKPLLAINHIEGHIAANFIQDTNLTPPFICLVVSGGHSHIVFVRDYDKFQVLGQTRDDAAGEAFDKVARALGLGYPGGPIVDEFAKQGNPKAIEFPRVYFNDDKKYDFSFSGIKTAVLNYLNIMKQKSNEIKVEDVCASFQKAVVDVLVNNLIACAVSNGVDKIALAGGVAANSFLRDILSREAMKHNLNVFIPNPVLCTDNAAMIGSCAYYKYLKGDFSDIELNAVANLKIGQKG